MKKSVVMITIGFSIFALQGCDKSNWRQNCEEHYSESPRALARCKASLGKEETTGISLQDLSIPRTPEEVGSA